MRRNWLLAALALWRMFDRRGTTPGRTGRRRGGFSILGLVVLGLVAFLAIRACAPEVQSPAPRPQTEYR